MYHMFVAVLITTTNMDAPISILKYVLVVIVFISIVHADKKQKVIMSNMTYLDVEYVIYFN